MDASYNLIIGDVQNVFLKRLSVEGNNKIQGISIDILFVWQVNIRFQLRILSFSIGRLDNIIARLNHESAQIL